MCSGREIALRSRFRPPRAAQGEIGETVPYARLGPARVNMQIRVGYELIYTFPQPTPIILALNIHYSRVSDIVRPDHMISSPPIPVDYHRDIFGNWCNRVLAPQGRLRLSAD